MKRWSSLLFAVLCLVGGLAVSPACAAEWTPVDAFLLGAVNQITGPGALSGQMRKNGYELGLDEVNASGGILGLPVKIVYEDDQTTNPGAWKVWSNHSR